MTFAWASQHEQLKFIDSADLHHKISQSGIQTNYYNAAIHQASFALPQYVLNATAESGESDE